jgi:hypothetical protein
LRNPPLVAAVADDREVIAPAAIEAAANDCVACSPTSWLAAIAAPHSASVDCTTLDDALAAALDDALAALAMLRDATGNWRSSAKLGTGGRGFPTAPFPFDALAVAALAAALAFAAASAYDNPDIAIKEVER